MRGMSVIVMGVASSGKSTVGELLSKKLKASFLDGDDLHSEESIAKMSSGVPLDDADREPWLMKVNNAVAKIEATGSTGVIVCSALKKRYRDMIRHGNSKVMFIFLDGTKELVLERIRKRENHYMKQEMVDSQFEALERPDNERDVIIVDINGALDEIVANSLAGIHKLEVVCD